MVFLTKFEQGLVAKLSNFDKIRKCECGKRPEPVITINALQHHISSAFYAFTSFYNLIEGSLEIKMKKEKQKSKYQSLRNYLQEFEKWLGATMVNIFTMIHPNVEKKLEIFACKVNN